ncbi:MAG: hypothetical protein ACM3XM_10835 [Mycobacterium leprae]
MSRQRLLLWAMVAFCLLAFSTGALAHGMVSHDMADGCPAIRPHDGNR